MSDPAHYSPSLNDGKHIFVFGSNLAGRHGKGAAKMALDHWGAVYGVGGGLQGRSYAIPTKDRGLCVLPLKVVEASVHDFLSFAMNHYDVTFLVTRIGCGLAGFSDLEIAPMFKDAPPNCVLPPFWRAFNKEPTDAKP